MYYVKIRYTYHAIVDYSVFFFEFFFYLFESKDGTVVCNGEIIEQNIKVLRHIKNVLRVGRNFTDVFT